MHHKVELPFHPQKLTSKLLLIVYVVYDLNIFLAHCLYQRWETPEHVL